VQRGLALGEHNFAGSTVSMQMSHKKNMCSASCIVRTVCFSKYENIMLILHTNMLMCSQRYICL
jgi:hypothetical protein